MSFQELVKAEKRQALEAVMASYVMADRACDLLFEATQLPTVQHNLPADVRKSIEEARALMAEAYEHLDFLIRPLGGLQDATFVAMLNGMRPLDVTTGPRAVPSPPSPAAP